MMTLFSDPSDFNSHRVRVVVKEKDIMMDIKEVDPQAMPRSEERRVGKSVDIGGGRIIK